MKVATFILIGILIAAATSAQEFPDPLVFSNPLEVAANPPRKVKGWRFVENESNNQTISQSETHSFLMGEYPAQIIKFPFSGNAIGIAVYSNEESGIIEFSVDEANWQTLDLFSAKQQLKFFTLESEIKGRKHMLQIRISPDKNPASKGNKCILRNFVVNKH